MVIFSKSEILKYFHSSNEKTSPCINKNYDNMIMMLDKNKQKIKNFPKNEISHIEMVDLIGEIETIFLFDKMYVGSRKWKNFIIECLLCIDYGNNEIDNVVISKLINALTQWSFHENDLKISYDYRILNLLIKDFKTNSQADVLYWAYYNMLNNNTNLLTLCHSLYYNNRKYSKKFNMFHIIEIFDDI